MMINSNHITNDPNIVRNYILEPVYPGIYEVKFNPVSKDYYLEHIATYFPLPPKFYGELHDLKEYYWKAIIKQHYSTGILLTGLAGSGKTELAKSICNNAISVGMRVLKLTNLPYNDKLITFLDKQDKAVFFFDEFGKTFRQPQQEKMLTLLSNTMGLERIVILTENEKSMINPFIRNRPGRIRYAKHFTKLSKRTITEYCNDNNVDEVFLRDLLSEYDTLTIFAFDHLKAIVSEHLLFPELTFKEIIGFLNLEFMSGIKVLKLVQLLDKKTNEEVPLERTKYIPKQLTLTMVENKQPMRILIIDEKKEGQRFADETIVELTITKLKSMSEDEVIYEDDSYKLTFSIVVERSTYEEGGYFG